MGLIPPTTHYLEGVLDLCYARGIHYCPHPEDGGPSCRNGYYIGRAILQLYAIEMYLRHALEDVNLSSNRAKHNLHRLFTMLPDNKKDLVKAKYADSMKRHVKGPLAGWYVKTGNVEDWERRRLSQVPGQEPHYRHEIYLESTGTTPSPPTGRQYGFDV